MSKQVRVTSPVELTKTTMRHGYAVYHVRLCGVNVQIEQDEYLAILAGQLPDSELVWSVNETAGSMFFRDGYPEWSVVPNPKHEVGGNIYFSTREEATRELVYRIEKKIGHLTQRAREEASQLQTLLATIKGEAGDE